MVHYYWPKFPTTTSIFSFLSEPHPFFSKFTDTFMIIFSQSHFGYLLSPLHASATPVLQEEVQLQARRLPALETAD